MASPVVLAATATSDDQRVTAMIGEQPVDRYLLSDYPAVDSPTALGLAPIKDPVGTAVSRCSLGVCVLIVGALSLAAWTAIWVAVATAVR